MTVVRSNWSKRAATVPVLMLIAAACGRGSSAGSIDTSTPTSSPPASTPTSADADTMTLLRGTVASATTGAIVVTTDSSTVTVKISEPFTVYDRAASNLGQVKDSTFIGVTTVKQPDGSERATEIHIFPNDLRGLGEGSRMMTAPTSGSASRMTNGSVSASRMTNGSASRMSNGTVGSATGSTLVVQYAGGSQRVTIPASVSVTEIKPVSKQLAPGDRVVLVAKRQPDGSLSSSKALIASK